ncbi:MAG TPA: VWA domain-containing protein, partial [Candidatus Binataceae bacterium]|nr:VWA domain-containing protein [Candidatus Binataceae bacterium]
EQLKLRPQDPVIVFGAKSLDTTVADASSMLTGEAGCEECDPSATNIEAAIERLAGDPESHRGSAILITDGWQNRGEAVRAIGSLVSAALHLYIFTPPPPRSLPNVAMTALALPSALSRATPFSLGVTMRNFNSVPVDGTIDIFRGNAPLDKRRVRLEPGEQRIDFPIRSEEAGLESYRAVFKPDDSRLDTFPEDDSLQGWVGVGARRKVLILTDTAKDAQYLERVVRAMGIEPVVTPVTGAPWDGSLKGYDLVILNNLPRERLSPAAQDAVVSYVERGGSIAMVGGDESFGLGGYADSPIARAMPVVMKPPQRKERQRALVLVIDKSGSMGREDKLTYAKAAAKTVTKSLKDNDLVSVIGFDSQPFVVVPLQTLAQSRPYFDDMVDRLKAQGRTYLLPALEQADRSLVDSGAAIKHVVILTDGETGGTADMYYSLVSAMHHDAGATVSTIAIGRQANLQLLEAISKYGGGGFYQTDSARNLPEIFLEDFKHHGAESTMVEKESAPRTSAGDPILKDYAGRQLPPLKGFVSTELRPKATLDAYIERDGRREPLIGSWKYGAGKALAVTTDASGRWSGPWIAANIFAPLWNRLIAWTTPEISEEQKLDVALGYSEGRIRIKLIDYGQHASTTRLVTTITSHPDGSKTETALTEEAPGEFSGSVEAPAAGTYYLEIKSMLSNKEPFPPLAYTVSPAIMAEVPRPAPNYALLEQLASATGGRLNPSTSDVEMVRPVVEERRALSAYLIVLAMILLVIETAVRRLTI